MGYLEEKKNLEKIAEYLDQNEMKIPYKFQDIGDTDNEVFPAIICVFRCGELDFDVILYNLGKWIHGKALLLNTNPFPSQTVLKIYEISLGLNYDLPECTFSLFKNNLYIEIDCLVGIPLKDFKAEFESIGIGIESFINVIKNQDISIKSTKGGLKEVKRQFE